MKCKVLMILGVLLLSFGISMAGPIPDPDNPDTITVVSTSVGSAQLSEVQAVVNVNLYNDEKLSGMQIPFHWSSPDITLDTVVFTGGRVDYVATKVEEIDNVNQLVIFGVIIFFEAYIPAGNGLIAEMHFTIPSGTADQVVTIDTMTQGPGDPLLTDTVGGFFLGQWQSGTLTIGSPSGVEDNGTPTPVSYSLNQNFPNPFNPTTTIAYSVERKENVNIAVYNILGQKVRTLVNGEKPAGSYTTVWSGTDENGTEVASGIYFYRMTTDSFNETRKMVLMR